MKWKFIVGALLVVGGIANISEDFGAFVFCSLLGALLILWGLKEKGVLFRKSPGKRQLSEETLRAVGVTYYESNIRKLAYSNPKWERSEAQILKDGDADRNIYKYNYRNKPVKLVAENNPHDKNAVAIYFADQLVGYISREENLHVRDILKNREIISISGFIGGGEFKVVTTDSNITSGEVGFSVTVRIKYI